MARLEESSLSSDGVTFREWAQPMATELGLALRRAGIPRNTVATVLQSGYYALEAETILGTGLYVSDGMYGSKTGFGLIPFDNFCAYLRANRLGQFLQVQKDLWAYRRGSTFVVSSIDEAVAKLKENVNAPFFEADEMAFRGQTRGYRLRRGFANPAARDRNGNEKLIIPSGWRPYVRDLLHRPFNVAPQSANLFLNNPGLASFVPEQARLDLRNYVDHGYVNMMDALVYRSLPSGPHYGPTEVTLTEKMRNRTLPTRYVRDSVKGRLLRQVPLILQHYGVPTPALDLTFDLRTACFFALMKFDVGPNGRARFIPSGSRESIVYGFVFHDPPVTRTNDLVQELNWFEEFRPVRPLRQACALRMTDSNSVNCASPDLAVILRLRGPASAFDLPDVMELFPSAADDPFYDLLLRLKREPGSNLSAVVEYDWAD